MATILNTKITKKNNVVNVQFNAKDFEKFCNVLGIYKEEFIYNLKSSESDYKKSRVKERKSLYELIKTK